MIESASKAITYQGKPARISVMRNDGFCWGRIRLADDGTQLDVTTRRDQYDEPDEVALAAFIRASQRPQRVEPAVGWTD